jgi:chorismate synthase
MLAPDLGVCGRKTEVSRLSYSTAGESHGACVAALVSGFPAGVAFRTEPIDAELRRRQGGYGRGKRMEMESDSVKVLCGVIGGVTIGSPILLVVENADATVEEKPPVVCPRPGHADLAGMIKYGFEQARPVLERASARETAARVAAGGLAGILLGEFGIEVFAHVIAVGGVSAEASVGELAPAREARERSELYCLDAGSAELMKQAIDKAKEAGDTVGGVFEVIVRGAPPGLGSYAEAPQRLDGRLAGALMSIPAIKGVEIGLGFGAAGRAGSEVHDPIVPGKGGLRDVKRSSNNAGGLEGGLTNGQDVVIRAAMKPISTLMQPLPSVDVTTGGEARASTERSDVCAVPAASVVAEAAVAFEIAGAMVDKFGGDSLDEMRCNFEGYLGT